MRNFILVVVFLSSAQLFSQLHFGIKGGVNYNSDSFREVSVDIIDGAASSRTGYHAGIWVRAKIPAIGWYIRPELVYTSLKSSVTLNDPLSTTASYNFQKLDIPVLLGKKFLKVAYFHLGPSFQYILDGDIDFDSFVSETNADGFTVGLQLGAGIELGKIGLDARWERAFSDVESNLISNLGGANQTSKFDTRVNQIIIGLSYRF